jgi:hypothetical protein
MKHFLLLNIFFLSALVAQSQCEPMTDFGDEEFGVAPDTIQNFVPGELSVLYVQQVDVKVPSDGGFADLPFITVDSVSLAGIFGLPDGLSYECASQTPAPCTFIGGTLGCAVISGVPEEEGVFDLQVILSVHTTGLGSIDFPFEGYRIVIGDVLSNDDVTGSAFALLPNTPNPANDFTSIQFSAPASGEAMMTVYDLVGKLVVQKQIRAVPGTNKIKLNTTDFHQGLYIVRLEAFGQSVSQRLVVSR